MRTPSIAGAFLLLALSPVAVHAAVDQNGYAPRYECRAGSPNCNVDVAALGKRACDQIITPSDPWSKIDWSNSTICLQAGDHTSKGALTIPRSAAGSGGHYKVLRYVRSGDTDDEPWKQSSSNRAKLSQLLAQGDYWVIHRLTFPGINGNGPSPRIESRAGARNQIYNRLLVDGNRGNSHYYGFSIENCGSTPNKITIQNSVFRNVGPTAAGKEAIAVNFPCGDDMHAVGNEIYDWVSHPIQLGRNAGSDGSRVLMRNTVVENNDLYVTNALYTDCSGNYTSSGPCSATESVISTKLRGAAGNETKMIQNRVWGTRYTDLNLCCNGTSGQAIGNYDNNEYILFQNNIIMDSQAGINNIASHNSFVGNIFYWIRAFRSNTSSQVINRWNSHGSHAGAYEAYLNTVILAEKTSFPPLADHDVDVRCNVFIDSGPKSSSGTPPADSVADHNAFYGTPSFAFNGTNTKIESALKLRANNETYHVGDLIRLSSNPKRDCTARDDADCFMYKVTGAGISAGSKPSYCTTLGCTTTDGGVTVTAVRGPYAFYRKLKTSPQLTVIPYAVPHAMAPEAYTCPADFASRRGVGVSDGS